MHTQLLLAHTAVTCSSQLWVVVWLPQLLSSLVAPLHHKLLHPSQYLFLNAHTAASQITASFPILVPHSSGLYYGYLSYFSSLVAPLHHKLLHPSQYLFLNAHTAASQITASFPILVPHSSGLYYGYLSYFSSLVAPLHHKLLHLSQYLFLNDCGFLFSVVPMHTWLHAPHIIVDPSQYLFLQLLYMWLCSVHCNLICIPCFCFQYNYRSHTAAPLSYEHGYIWILY